MRQNNLAHGYAMVCLGVRLSLGGGLAYGNTKVRVGVLKFGTVNRELDTLTARGLDRRHGISVEVVPPASKHATAVALQGDAAIFGADRFGGLGEVRQHRAPAFPVQQQHVVVARDRKQDVQHARLRIVQLGRHRFIALSDAASSGGKCCDGGSHRLFSA